MKDAGSQWLGLMLGISSPEEARAAKANAIRDMSNNGQTCSPGLQGNGVCDGECNSIAFDFDGGDCDPSGGCAKHTDCGACLGDEGAACAWCGHQMAPGWPLKAHAHKCHLEINSQVTSVQNPLLGSPHNALSKSNPFM